MVVGCRGASLGVTPIDSSRDNDRAAVGVSDYLNQTKKMDGFLVVIQSRLATEGGESKHFDRSVVCPPELLRGNARIP